MSEFIDIAPRPRNHIKTLMRIGYNLNSAVADIIDNSITAKAKNIYIDSPPGLTNPYISILDDGIGMNREELISNMRIGCKNPNDTRDSNDLGRFGSGMKTASFSHARKLTVISRKSNQPITAAIWDIDRIEKTDSWSLEVVDDIEKIEHFNEKEFPESGTLIIWEKISRYSESAHSDIQSAVSRDLVSISKYVALHFHRFMEGQDKVRMYVNRKLLKPIDPFLKHSKGYRLFDETSQRIRNGRIEIKAHILPHYSNISEKDLESLGGHEEIARKQGYYIYRGKRLIIDGDWLGLEKNFQHHKYTRIQVDVPNSMDDEWVTDVKKSSFPGTAKSKKAFEETCTYTHESV